MLNRDVQRSLRTDRRGVALVEFAYTLPLFVLLITGGLEVTNLALVHLRLNHVAETAADNAARVRGQMDENDIEEIFAGIDKEGEAIDLKNKGRLVLSSVQDNAQPGSNKGQMIRWQRCQGGKTAKAPKYGKEGKGKTDSALKDGMGPPGRRIAAQPGTAVMFVEVAYDYEPMIFDMIIAPRELRYESAFNVRERTELGITNVRGKPVKSC
jgi:TadE-like protein